MPFPSIVFVCSFLPRFAIRLFLPEAVVLTFVSLLGLLEDPLHSVVEHDAELVCSMLLYCRLPRSLLNSYINFWIVRFKVCGAFEEEVLMVEF